MPTEVHTRFRDIMTAPKFLAWLQTKPPDEKFAYGDGENCAVAQYLTSNDFPFRWVGGLAVEGLDPTDRLPIPDAIKDPMGDLLRLPTPGTAYKFGQLAASVQEHLDAAKKKVRP